jgi:hypothetical protein
MRCIDESCACCGLRQHVGTQALSPHYIFLYFIRNGYTSWYSLGGTVLAITDTPFLQTTQSSCHLVPPRKPANSFS